MEEYLRRSGALILLPAIAYLVGWQYLSEYFKCFGLNVATLTIPFEYYFVQAFGVVASSAQSFTWLGASMLCVISLYLVVALTNWASFERFRAPIGILLGMCIAIAGFFFAKECALRDALALAQGNGGRTVQFIFREEFRTNSSPRLRLANDQRRLGVVWQDKDFWAVVEQIPDVGDGGFTPPFTYQVGNDSVIYAFSRDPNRLYQAFVATKKIIKSEDQK